MDQSLIFTILLFIMLDSMRVAHLWLSLDFKNYPLDLLIWFLIQYDQSRCRFVHEPPPILLRETEWNPSAYNFFFPALLGMKNIFEFLLPLNVILCFHIIVVLVWFILLYSLPLLYPAYLDCYNPWLIFLIIFS